MGFWLRGACQVLHLHLERGKQSRVLTKAIFTYLMHCVGRTAKIGLWIDEIDSGSVGSSKGGTHAHIVDPTTITVFNNKRCQKWADGSSA